MSDTIHHTFGDDCGISERSVWENYRKLVATITCGGVNLPDAFLNLSADGSDDLVAGTVAEGIVYFFEIVDVNHNERNQSTVTSASEEFPFEDLVKGSMVGEAGQAVNGGLMLHFFEEFYIANRGADELAKQLNQCNIVTIKASPFHLIRQIEYTNDLVLTDKRDNGTGLVLIIIGKIAG